jgi:fatty-acyl-CoA synthase
VDDIQDLRRQAAARPEHVALACGKRRVTYAELEAIANKFAALLRARGLERGDHIAMLVGNRPEALALAWAAWRTGLYLTPISSALAPPEVRYLVADSNAKAVFVDAAMAPLAREVDWPPSVRLWLLNGSAPGFDSIDEELASASSAPARHEPPGALMMYTSGTTGAPKGVVRPLLPEHWKGTPPFAADLIALFGIGGADVRYLSTAPLYHAAPLRTALAVTAGGGTAYVMDRFDAEAALDLLASEAITHSQWVPAMFQRLLALPQDHREAFRAPTHRTAIHGAAPCAPAVKHAMIEWWGPILLEYYSGTEGVGLTLITSQEALRKPGSVGRTKKGQLHIADTDGQEAAIGATGLVCFSGIAPFEYYKAPEKTASRTLPQGWQTFGDIGHVDEDGYLYLTDRADDMIISGGVNVYPQEIEAVVRDVPGVWDCAVVGAEDERFGERPVAFIVVRQGENAEAIRAFIERRVSTQLGRVKRPDSIHFIDELPRSATGKLLRRRLRELLPKKST